MTDDLAIFDAGPGAFARQIGRGILNNVATVTASEPLTLEMLMKALDADRRRAERKRPPRRFIARDDVPTGRVFPMWATDGTYDAYINRSVYEAIPRRRWMGFDIATSTLCPPGLLGIQIVVEPGPNPSRTGPHQHAAPVVGG